MDVNTDMDVLDILLKTDIPKPRTKQIRIKRLSEHCGEPVIFTIKQLSYSRVAELKKEDDMSLYTVLAGVIEPDLKNADLLKKHNTHTPAELVKILLIPGEIEDLAIAIEKLSGYRVSTIEELKKK